MHSQPAISFIARIACVWLAFGATPLAHAGAEIAELVSVADVVNVKDFGARGDGATDDTLAIKRAIDSVPVAPGRTFWKTPIVYFPKGTYIVSATIDRRDGAGKFTSGMVLVGESRAGSIIRLKNNAPGFDDAQNPKSVIMTSARLLDGSATSGGKDYTKLGEGNDAYANYVEDLTIDVGAGNAGAVALDYLSNNIGAVRRVTLIGRNGSGAVGLSLRRKWIGPALVSDLKVEGFGRGIDVANTEYGVAMNQIDIRNSRIAGLRNEGNLVAVDNIHIVPINGRPAIENTQYGGLIVATNATLEGSGSAAIVNQGFLNLTGVDVRGFSSLLPGAGLTTRQGRYRPGNTRLGNTDWSLAPSNAPAPIAVSKADTANVTDFGAVGDPAVDSTAAIKAAFASGAQTVLFPYGTYMVTQPIDIPPRVRRVLGMFAAITVGDMRIPTFDRTENGVFRIASSGEPLSIEKLTFDMTDRGGQLAFEFSGGRVLSLQDIATAGVTLMLRRSGGGPLYVDNACCGGVNVSGPAGAWMRQFNSEARTGIRLTNNGSPIRVLGMKTESETTVLLNQAGGTAEIVGGFFYPVTPGKTRVPLVINKGGRVALSYVEEAFRSDAVYGVHLQSRGGTGEIRSGSLLRRNQHGARIVPQLMDDTP